MAHNLSLVASNVLDEYDWPNDVNVLDKINNDMAENKKEIMDILRKHPNWNEEKRQIQFTADYMPCVDVTVLTDFWMWAIDVLVKRYSESVGVFSAQEIKEITRNLNNTVDNMWNITQRMRIPMSAITIGGRNGEEILAERNKWDARRDNLCEYNYTLITRDDAKRLNAAGRVIDLIRNHFTRDWDDLAEAKFCTEEFADAINNYFPNSAKRGQKIMKIVTEIFGKRLGLQDVVQIKTQQQMNHEGEIIERTRDMGWNYWRAKVGDAISPNKITRHTIISCNLVDYLTMSFGNSWASCHTIDK